MIRKCAEPFHNMTIGEAAVALNLYGSARLMPDRTPNPLMASGDPADRRLAKRRGRERMVFVRRIKALVSRGGWVTMGDIGILDFEAILRVIYNLPQLDQETRGKNRNWH